MKQGFYSSDGTFVPYLDNLEPHKGNICTNICSLKAPHWDFFDDMKFTADDHDVEHDTVEKISTFAPADVAYMDEKTRGTIQLKNSALGLIFVIALACSLTAFLVMRLVFQKMIDVRTGNIAASVVQSVCIVTLNYVYCRIGVCLVNQENYRTDQEWENALVRRVFLFQFINSYFTLFYTAFLKGHIGPVFGYDDHCKDREGNRAHSCMYELNYLLLSTLLMVQIVSTINEALLPVILYQINMRAERIAWRAKGNQDDLKISEVGRQAHLTPNDPRDTFNDYNKIIIQYGYVTMFCAAFPLGPAVALVNNLIEMRTDGWKRLKGTQRPANTERAEDIGEWMNILQLMSIIAVVTNVGVLCFTSKHLMTVQFHVSAENQIWTFIALEHLIIVAKLCVMLYIPDVPEWVKKRSARDAYMLNARQEIIVRQQWDTLK